MNRKFIVFAILLIIYILALNYLNIIFIAGDDGYMMRIANGSFFGTKDYHLVFINSILGYFFVFLYTNWPTYEWYFIIFILSQFLSSFIIIIKLQEKTGSLKSLIFLLPLFYYLCYLNFTTLSFLLSFASFLLLESYLKDKKIISIITSLILLLIGMLYRFDMVILCFGILALYLILKNYRKKLKILIIYLSIACINALIINTINNKTYKENQDWIFYSEYNKERGTINDNFGIGYLLAEYEQKKNPAKNDLELAARRFIFTDAMTLEALKGINNKLKTNHSIFIYNVLKNLRFTNFFYLLIFSIISILICIINKKFQLIAVIGVLLLLMSYLMLTHTLKDRIILPMIFLSAYLVLENAKINFSKENRIQSILFIFLAAIIIKIYIFYPESKKKFEHLNLPEDTIMLDGSNYFSQTTIQKIDEKSTVIPGGWLTNLPLLKQKYKKHHPSIHLSLVDDKHFNDKHLYYIAENNTQTMIEKHLKKNKRRLIKIKTNLFRISNQLE
ncbi:hypothetical protein [Chryseobacterium binzhouense]|uniref:hypothetical protein n=1 Tax=Chryseobacterium binzhouense TaxID=2593646 RepID=UPI00117E9EFC|nr:hypothetical protein [Chryseobacterium binzhouense]